MATRWLVVDAALLVLATGAILPLIAFQIAWGWARHHCCASRRRRAPPPPAALTPSASRLAALLREGSITSHTLVSCSLAHARAVDHNLACVVAFRDEEVALTEASHADALLLKARESGNWDAVPPFCGVPMSVKEVVRQRGTRQTSSLVPRLAAEVEADDSALVATLRTAGFVLVTCTTTSELCMWYESQRVSLDPRTHKWRRQYTCNPYDTQRIVGGSSGGEAAIIAAAAVPCGVGSDIGGSIRMPAAFCGIFGIKPSGGLVTNRGQLPTTDSPVMTTGPLCRHSEDLWSLLMVMASAHRAAVPTTGDASLRSVPMVEVSLPLTPHAKEPTYLLVPSHLMLSRRAGPRSRSPQPRARRESSTRKIHERPTPPALQQPENGRALLTHSPHPRICSWKGVTIFTLHELDRNTPRFSTAVQPSIKAAISRCVHTMQASYGCRVASLPLPEMHDAFELWSSVIALDEGARTFREWMELGHGRPLDLSLELLAWAVGRSQATLPALVLALIERLPMLLTPERVRRMAAVAAEVKTRLHATLSQANGVLICPVHPTVAPLHNVPLIRPFNVAYTQLFNVTESPATVVPVGLDGDGLPIGVQVVGGYGFDALTIAVARALEGAGAAGWVPP